MQTHPRSHGAILVTGAAGFIGARFIESCNHKDIPVISVDKERHFQERPEHTAVRFGRMIDRTKLFHWLDGHTSEISAIVHLGACTDTTQMDTAFLNRVNLEYSQNLWTIATNRRIPMIYASSAATYGDGSAGYNDDEVLLPKLHPLNPYGDSKHRFDLWALHADAHSAAPPHWTGFKFFNVYGFGERHKKKMSSMVLQAFDQIRQTGEVRLFKSHRKDIPDGEQKRDFIFVEDVVQALHFALKKPIPRGIYNLGSGQAHSFLELVRAVFKALNVPERITFVDTPVALRERYQYFTEARMDRLRTLGFPHSFHSLDDGVRLSVERLLKEAPPAQTPA